MTFRRPRCAMPIRMLPDAGLARLGNHLVEDRHEHVEPLDREARLARERAVQEALERLDLRQTVEQLRRDRSDRPARGSVRARPPAEAIRALRARTHARSRSRSSNSRCGGAPRSRRSAVVTPSSGPATRFAGRLRRSSSVTPWVAASSEGSPIGGRLPSGSSWAARCPYRRIDSARLTAPTIFSSGMVADRAAGASSSAGGVQRSNSARVSGSTDDGFWRYFS